MSACAIAVLAACRPAPRAPDLDAMAARYIQLARELAQHDPSLVDHWIVEPPGAPGPRRPVYTLESDADALVAETNAALLETDGVARARAEWLHGQARALGLASLRLMGKSQPFDAEARMALGVAPARADRFQADRAYEALGRELPGPGPLAARLATFRAGFHVSPAAREPVVRAALDACRAAVAATAGLPADESVEVAFVAGLPWDANARYLGAHRTRIQIADAPLDLTRALRLACHEGYAGHHAQHLWIADELVARRRWQERALVPGFGPALLTAEGAAEAGTDLAMPPDRRAAVYRDALMPVARLSRSGDDLDRLVRVEQALAALEPLIADIARDYLDNRINAAAATQRLTDEALLPDPDAFVTFIERRRTRIVAYTEGRRLALERLSGAGLQGLRGLFVPHGN